MTPLQNELNTCTYSDKLLTRLDILNQSVKNKVNINEIKKAVFYAKRYHGKQLRQSGEFYYTHPLEVAYMLAE